MSHPHTMQAEASTQRGLVSAEAAELNERAAPSSGTSPSGLLDPHSACAGICPYLHYAHHLSSSGSPSHNHAHSVKRTNEIEEATSAPACTNAVTRQGDTWEARHTFHYHHHYYHYEWPSGDGGPMRSGHVGPGTVCCCAMNSPHEFSSHGGRPINCPVNRSPPFWACPAPRNSSPVPTSSSKRFPKHAHAENDSLPTTAAAAGAAEAAAPSLTVLKASPPLPSPLPPFPSPLLSSPYVLCQRCSRLLLLPPGALLSPPPGTLLLASFLYVKLKCGFCLNISKFSTRHLYRAPSSSLATPPPPPPPPTQSMPSCITSNGVMQEASEFTHHKIEEEPISVIPKPALESNSVNLKGACNGNVDLDLERAKRETGAAPLNGVCKHTLNQHIETNEQPNGMCGDSTTLSKLVETRTLSNGQENVIEIGKSVNDTCGDLAESKHVETVELLDCNCLHTQEILIERTEPLDGICGDSTQSKHVETGALLNGKCAHTEEIAIEAVQHVNDTCRDVAQPKHLETGTLASVNCEQTSKDNDIEAGPNGVCDDMSDNKVINMSEQDNGAMHNSHSDREQEVTAYSAVQDWVDSLSMEIGYESDNQLQEPLNDCVYGLDKCPSPHERRFTLHQHFGYSSPSELFEKILFSEDEEIKARTETNSTMSSSFSSTNAFQPTETKSPSTQVRAPSLRSWHINTAGADSIGVNEQEAQSSFAGLLKKSLKRGSLLPASSKTRVVVNGHTLSSAVVKQAEKCAGKLRPGSYWYDCKAGFWGVEGGPCLGILPPFIKELNYPLTRQCSKGDTQVYVNGRELHVKDLAILSQRGLSQKAGKAYALGFDGVLVDETTGLELKHLGKLAPTVERNGKGFGMFMADVLQSKASAVYR